ncbi:MAG TPA: hypothetical protein VLK25_12800 [Allosphingosinicella sp.]|nr:hypothetical protein [Allosphingosinicella sp.]
MRILTIAALAAALAAAPASAADLSGRYVAEGSCPAPNSAYRGTLTIRSEGLFHTLNWQVGDETIVGTGMEHDGRMVIEFRFASGQSGLMDMNLSGGVWRGNWAVHGSNLLCSETWVPMS